MEEVGKTIKKSSLIKRAYQALSHSPSLNHHFGTVSQHLYKPIAKTRMEAHGVSQQAAGWTVWFGVSLILFRAFWVCLFFLVKGFVHYSPKRRTRSDMTHGSESHACHTWRHRTFAFACFSRVFTKENQRDKRKEKKMEGGRKETEQRKLAHEPSALWEQVSWDQAVGEHQCRLSSLPAPRITATHETGCWHLAPKANGHHGAGKMQGDSERSSGRNPQPSVLPARGSLDQEDGSKELQCLLKRDISVIIF